MTMTNDGRAVLRTLGGHLIADVLIDPKRGAAALKASCWGGSQLRGYPEGTGFQCEKRGIVVTRYDVPDDAHDADGFITADGHARIVRTELIVVTWKQIDEYAWTIPLSLRRQLRAARSEQTRVTTLWFDRCHPRAGYSAPFDGLAWAHHLVQARAADAALDRCLVAALADEPVVVTPEQLDLFANAS